MPPITTLLYHLKDNADNLLSYFLFISTKEIYFVRKLSLHYHLIQNLRNIWIYSCPKNAISALRHDFSKTEALLSTETGILLRPSCALSSWWPEEGNFYFEYCKLEQLIISRQNSISNEAPFHGFFFSNATFSLDDQVFKDYPSPSEVCHSSIVSDCDVVRFVWTSFYSKHSW